MLFRKKLPRSCGYCKWGTTIQDDQILCTKQGVVSEFFSCRKFCYDPIKRTPVRTKALDFHKYNNEDFKL